MSELRNAFMNEGQKRPSDEVEVTIGGEPYTAEVRALSVNKSQRLTARDYGRKPYSQEDAFIAACVYDPDTGESVFDSPKEVGDAPAVVGGWYQQLSKAIARVHGEDVGQPGVRVDDERLDQIRQLAGDLRLEIADEEGIDEDRREDYCRVLEQMEAGALALSRMAGDEGNPMGGSGNA